MSGPREGDGSRWTTANAMTSFRLVAAPVMIVLAVAGEQTMFLLLLGASFVSDAADGALARLSGGATGFGAKLDTIADVVAYSAITISIALLRPDLVLRELVLTIVLVASFSLPALIGIWKYRQITSYHTRLVKIAVAAVAIGLLCLLMDISVWPLRLAAVVAVASAVEQIAMTLLMSEPKSDVSSFIAAWRDWQSARDRSRGAGLPSRPRTR